MAWSVENMPDLSGKLALVTGANSGLGYQTTYQLAKNHAHVVMACRTKSKADQAIAQIKQSIPDADLSFIPLDLADLASVKAFAKEFKSSFDKLDILVNNAGIGSIPFLTTKDGIEMNFGTNHIGHFALTIQLLDCLNNASNARIVNVSSEFNRLGNDQFDDINYEKTSYNKWKAYGRSKLANALFTLELNRRLQLKGYSTIAITCHPGYSSTNLQTRGYEMENANLMINLTNAFNSLVAQSDVDGALPSLYAATGNDVSAGDYIGPRIIRWRGKPVKQKACKTAYNTALAQKLWDLSEKLSALKSSI